MNLLLYLTVFKFVIFCIAPIINGVSNNKIFECHQNNIKILYDTSNNAKSKLPMSPSCFQLKKHFKNNEIKYKGPDISDLLQSGIQKTIQFTKKLTDQDTYRFYEKKNVFVDIPFPSKVFKFRAFSPDNFLTLRNLYNISKEFNSSFQNSRILSDNSKGGNMDTYFMTGDYKFYIDIISVENFEFIVSFLTKYFSHFCQNQLSLLPKIAGLFHLKHKNFELYFIVKPYIFPNVPRSNDEVYYTKGIPEKGFLIDDTSNSKDCHIEQYFKFTFKKGLILPFDTHTSFQKVLEKDTMFLKSLDISDYIFMLSISQLDTSSNDKQSTLVNILRDVKNPDQHDTKTTNLNLIAYIGIDNIYQKRKKDDQSYYNFHYLKCMFKHQVNQNTYDYGQHLWNYLTKQVFKSNGK